jgi:outer membrane protein OmpA-like peptidoglycan-associated protein
MLVRFFVLLVFSLGLISCNKQSHPPFGDGFTGEGEPSDQLPMDPSLPPETQMIGKNLTTPSTPPLAYKTQSFLEADNITLSGDLIQYLSQEYEVIGEKMAKVQYPEAGEYFKDKAKRIRINYQFRARILDNKLKETQEGFTLNENFRKIQELFKPNNDFVNSKADIVAKLIANYECAVFEIEKTVESQGQMVLNNCYDSLHGLMKVVEDEYKVIGPKKRLADSKFVEHVEKTFTVVEFEEGSSAIDIFKLDRFKEVAEILKNYPKYKLVVIGYQLGSDSKVNNPTKSNDDKMSKERVLSVMKALVMQGLDKDKIYKSHPDPKEVAFLFNIKQGTKNLVVIDIDVNG